MRKKALSFLLGCLAMPLMAQVAPLEGFYYGSMQAPTVGNGKAWILCH